MRGLRWPLYQTNFSVLLWLWNLSAMFRSMSVWTTEERVSLRHLGHRPFWAHIFPTACIQHLHNACMICEHQWIEYQGPQQSHYVLTSSILYLCGSWRRGMRFCEGLFGEIMISQKWCIHFNIFSNLSIEVDTILLILLHIAILVLTHGS